MTTKAGRPSNKAILSLKADDRIAVTGQPGTGKTTLVAYLASLIPPDELLIYDPLDQYRAFEIGVNRYVPKDTNPRQEFNTICRQVLARRNMTLVVEESQRYFPESQALGDDVTLLVNRGRNYGIGIIASTQRIQHMNKAYFDLAQFCIFFRCGPQSRSYIRSMFGREIAERVQALPDHVFLHYNLHTDKHGIATLKIPGQVGKDLAIPATAQVVATKDTDGTSQPSDKPDDKADTHG